MLALLILACSWLTCTQAADPDDKHYNEAGFFDIHVCNWPGRPLFFMPLFSTPSYDEIQRIEVLNPDGSQLLEMDLSHFRIISNKGKPEKHVIINQLDVPVTADDGWYTVRVSLHSGKTHTASDYVIISRLARTSGQQPADGQDLAAPPAQLHWRPVDGAGFYQVFIRDKWNDDKLIYTSRLLDKPELKLPAGLFEDSGLYSWVIHARDSNEDVLLGDFNHGSMSLPVSFSVNSGRQ